MMGYSSRPSHPPARSFAMSRQARTSRRRSPAPARGGNGHPQGERLQKVLAAAGLGSRRQCEQLIEEGRVEIDRRVVSELGVRVEPAKQEIRVDGDLLPRPKLVYYALNKPRGVVCTNNDPQGRMRVVDLIGGKERLFAVGRLDRMSEGLILVTNDGALANQLTHPRYGVEKTYRVVVAGHPDVEALRQLRHGVHLAEGIAHVVSVRVKRRRRQSTELEIVLNEGRNREIRRILAHSGHKVQQLSRVAVGSIRLGEMPSGAYRPLTRDEVRRLQRSLDHRRRDAGQRRPQGGRGKRTENFEPAVGAPRGGAKPRRKPSPQTSSSKARRKNSRPKSGSPSASTRAGKPAKGRRR